jgi:hypothetical protein
LQPGQAAISANSAYHAFDNFERSSEPAFLDQAQTTRNCRVIEDGRGLVNAKTGTPYDINNECVERGAHVAYNAAATAAATKAVKEFFRKVFSLNSVSR